MIKFSKKVVAVAGAGLTLAGAGVTTAVALDGPAHRSAHSRQNAATPDSAAYRDQALQALQAPAGRPAQAAERPGKNLTAEKTAKADKPKKREKKIALPSGVSTATSFWDAQTASGKPMSYQTIASPYWPLGTKVKITYNGKSDIGVVTDFGPAEWAVAQHNPPAIIDLSEEMMRHLTGVRSNSVTIKFQVLQMGDGRVYRHGGTGYGLATGD